jgi:hypothetical protein
VFEFLLFGFEALRLMPLGFPPLDFQPMDLHAFFPAALTLEPLSFFGTLALLGLETFGLGSLGPLGSTLLRCGPVDLDPFGLAARQLNPGLLHPALFETLRFWALCREPGSGPLPPGPLQRGKINDLEIE